MARRKLARVLHYSHVPTSAGYEVRENGAGTEKSRGRNLGTDSDAFFRPDPVGCDFLPIGRAVPADVVRFEYRASDPSANNDSLGGPNPPGIPPHSNPRRSRRGFFLSLPNLNPLRYHVRRMEMEEPMRFHWAMLLSLWTLLSGPMIGLPGRGVVRETEPSDRPVFANETGDAAKIAQV